MIFVETRDKSIKCKGIKPYFCKFGEIWINWTKLDSKLDYFECMQTPGITGFFNIMLIFGQ